MNKVDKLKVAFICSNIFNIGKRTTNGTAIFNRILINDLHKYARQDLEITAFASGASSLPVKIESIDFNPSSANKDLILSGKHFIYELALISKAFSAQNNFDIFHFNIGDGDLAIPFSIFVRKPILITLHHVLDAEFTRKYFSMFKKNKKIFFVSASNAQRKLLPDLNYISTVYHGIDINNFKFHPRGGEKIIWVGRFIPQKGAHTVIDIAKQMKKSASLFGVFKKEHEDWLKNNVFKKINSKNIQPISLYLDSERLQLARHYETSKLFLCPIEREEAFGLVLIESMACGTPVVAFARGSVPEIIKDGVTGFIVNPSNNDIRGDWITKKTGNKGLREAVKKIYSMPERKYLEMRRACRERVIQHFTSERMAKDYCALYKKIVSAQSCQTSNFR